MMKNNYKSLKCATLTAMPLMSDEYEAPVAVVLGTVSVLISELYTFDTGIPRALAAIFVKEKQRGTKKYNYGLSMIHF